VRVHLLAVGERMPDWVEAGYRDYARRLRGGIALELRPLRAGRRARGADPARARSEEADRLLAAVPAGARVVALDAGGEAWSTEGLAESLRAWLPEGRDLALLVGGADGLDPRCLQVAERVWSLSALTFPHALVRVLIAEQLYRAWSLLQGHPYHRA
jgi:23S rRNA (pseudouridine1915-N3)-methyltransferase